jgi:mycothione reductase
MYDPSMRPFSLAVVGAGSGNLSIPDDFARGRVALIESGPFGGTCLNRGCIPSKMLVHTADLARGILRARPLGLVATLENVDWKAIRQRVTTRIDETSARGRKKRLDSRNVELFEGHAHFVGPRELVINGVERIEAEQIVIATGGRPSIPPIVAKSGVAFHTSDTIMRVESLPSSMVILGGGSVAVELAHIFSSFGVDIHVVEMAATLLESVDRDIAERFTEHAAGQWDVHLGVTVTNLRVDVGGVVLELDNGQQVTGDQLLVATGRQPNTEDLGLEMAGIRVGPDGHIVVDEFGRAAQGIWALGDCSSSFELKHVANAEARTIAHNLSHPDDLRPLPHDWVPMAIFSDPQVASVGARSQDLDGSEYVEAVEQYGDVAYGWALEDTTGICRVYADPQTGLLLGAHILGPEASLLIAPLIQAMAHGQHVMDLARGQYWIHPALSEVVENALLKLPLDQRVLSGQSH